MRLEKNKILTLASTVAAVLAGLGTAAAHATPLPATSFTSTVSGSPTGNCGFGLATDGTCSSALGSATTDGGVLGNTGTGVGTSTFGPGVMTFATMTYYFEVGGPTVPAVGSGPPGQIAVDILSSGSAFLSGGTGLSFVSMLITDAGSDADILAGVPDPDQGLVLDSRSYGVGCGPHGCASVGSPWAQSTQVLDGFTPPDHLCLTQGDRYAITITASTIAGTATSGGAAIDPKIIVDPQGPTDPKAQCFQPDNPLFYQDFVTISGGASTGVSVPEPGTLGLMGLGLFGVGVGRRFGRRVRQPA